MKMFHTFTLCALLFIIDVHFIKAETFGFLQNRHTNGTLKIIGGREAFPHSLGYQVGIRIEEIEGPVSFCGGSLITPSFVLTAAHCLRSVYSLEVILGAHNISKNEWTQIRITPTNYTVHPNWDIKHLTNDIALIELPKPVKTGWIIRTIRLPNNDKENYTGSIGLVSGWGMTKYNNTISDVLEYAKSTIMSNADCKKIDPFGKVIQETHLCLSGRGQISSCEGDSGGPLVVNGVQVGVVSFTLKKCSLATPSVFTRISKYLDWIREHSDL